MNTRGKCNLKENRGVIEFLFSVYRHYFSRCCLTQQRCNLMRCSFKLFFMFWSMFVRICVCDSQSPGNTEELERHQTSCWQTILSICSCNPSMEMRCIHFIQRDKASFFKCSFWAITLITDSTELPDKYRCEEPYSFCSLSQTITHYQFKKTKQINKFLESI